MEKNGVLPVSHALVFLLIRLGWPRLPRSASAAAPAPPIRRVCARLKA